MEKGFDLRIAEFKKDLGITINNANMPISVTKMVLGELLNEVMMLTTQAIDTQKKMYDEELEKEKSSKK